MDSSRSDYSIINSGRMSAVSSNSNESGNTSHSFASSKSKIGSGLHHQSGFGNGRKSFGQNRKSSIRPDVKFSPGSRMTDFCATMYGGRDPDGFVRRRKDKDCLKCMLRVPHTKCVCHKYIRIGGGYRHSYLYVRMLLEQILLKTQREEMIRRRLEAIAEGNTRAVKMMIRTKSGRLVEKIFYFSDEDYKAFQKAIGDGKDPASIFSKYLNQNEMDNLQSYDKDEQQAIKTYVRTKSGRLIEKIIYISKKEAEAMQRGELDANDILRKKLGLKSGERLEGWQKSGMRTITTKVRTKSGRIIEKQIQISEEDYQKLMAGGNMDEILKKYQKPGESSTVLGWEKSKKPGMKVVKTMIRTKSGRLIEKTIMMTEEEYKDFLKSNGDPSFLKKYLNLKEGENIENWEKGSTVYAGSDDEELQKAKPGVKMKDKDGNEYVVVVDPLTGKKYKKIINKNENDLLTYKTKDGKIITEKDIKKRNELKQGRRNVDSASEYSYRSFVSAGGTRHVRRKKRNKDGTYNDSDSYHSSQDEAGQKRRRQRRRERKHGANSAHSYTSVVSAGGTRHVRRRKKNADGTYGDSESYHSADSGVFKDAEKSIKAQKKKLKEAKDDDSDASLFSVVSEGGTKKKMKRVRIRNEQGDIIGYGRSEEVDAEGRPLKKKKGKQGREHGSDSENSYFSEVSVGGTRIKKKRKRIRDKDGKVIGHGKSEDYSSDEEIQRKHKKRGGPNSAYSYSSEVSEGGTRVVKKKLRIRDADGNIIGHAKSEVCSSSAESFITVSDGKGGKMKVKNPKKKKKFSLVFSDATTDSDIVKARLENMTEEEKARYLEERDLRAKEREDNRRKKYGDDYEKMKKIYEKKKEIYKEKVKNEERKNRRGTLAGDSVQGGRTKGRFDIDGNDADSEGETRDDIRLKKNFNRKGSESVSIEVIRDKDGNIIKRIKKDKDGNIYEEEYDKDGNVISKKMKGKDKKNKGSDDDDDDDGDYFEIGPDGKLRLKGGKKIIDLSKISREDLIKLGIDPNLTKAEIMRLLQEKLGSDIQVVFKQRQIGTKHADDYDSDVNTSDLANDSDLDVDTANPESRVKIIEKRGGQKLREYMRQVLEQSKLSDQKVGDEKDSKINFLYAYRLVDPEYLEKYARFFAVEDHDDMDGIITYKGCLTAIHNLRRTNVIKNLTDTQINYIMLALDIDKQSEISFRMFSVIAALGDRMTKLDGYCRDLLEVSDLLDIARKLKFYRDLFNMNVLSDRDPNYIKVESISIDLRAGGLNRDQQAFIISKLKPNELLEISFIEYLCYIPLFISYHDKIVDNPLDMSSDKYSHAKKRRVSIQRDMNPMGYPLSKNSTLYKSLYLQSKPSVSAMAITDDSPINRTHRQSKDINSKYPPIPGINSSKKM